MFLGIKLLFINNFIIFVETTCMKKISFSLTAFLVTASGILIIIYLFNSIKAVRTTGSSSVIHLPDTDTAFGGIFSSLHTEDSMPYYEYKKAEDSFNRIKQIRDVKNNGLAMGSFSSGGIGIFSAKKRLSTDLPLYRFDPNNVAVKSLIDSLNKVYPNPSAKKLSDEDEIIHKKINDQLKDKTDSVNRELEKEKLYYFGLSGYELKDYDSKFYIDSNGYNLAYVKWNTPVKTEYKHGHYENKQIKIRYASDTKRILIPISEKTYKILNFIIWVFAFFTGAVILYFFFGLPIRLLINISKGLAFIERNIQILNQISAVALIISVVTIISPYIFRLMFWKIIPDDFKMQPFLNRIIDNLPVLIMVLITFFIAKAFKKGYKLQYEQDLTI